MGGGGEGGGGGGEEGGGEFGREGGKKKFAGVRNVPISSRTGPTGGLESFEPQRKTRALTMTRTHSGEVKQRTGPRHLTESSNFDYFSTKWREDVGIQSPFMAGIELGI